MSDLFSGLGSNTYALALATVLVLATVIMWQAGILRRAPVLLHNGAWAASLAVLGTNVVHFTYDSFYTWVLITAGIVAFNLAVIIPSRSVPARRTLRPLMTRREYRLLLAGYSLSFVYYLRAIKNIVGLSTLIHNPSLVRSEGSVINGSIPLPVKLLFYLGPFLVVIALNRWTVRRPRHPRRTTQVVTVACLAVSLLVGVQRTVLFNAALWEVALLIIYPNAGATQAVATARRTKTRRNLAVLGMIAAAVGAFQLLAVNLNKTGNENPYIQGALSSSIQGKSYASIPVYAAGGIPALSNLVESRNHQAPPVGLPAPQIIGDYNPQTWGRATFQALLKLAPVFPAWNSVAPYSLIPFPSNVYTWYEPYFRDFRAPGVIIFTALSGLLVIFVFNRRYKSTAWGFLAALFIGYTALAPFANRFTEVFTIEYVVLLAYLGRTRRPPAPPEAVKSLPQIGREVSFGQESAGTGMLRRRGMSSHANLDQGRIRQERARADAIGTASHA